MRLVSRRGVFLFGSLLSLTFSACSLLNSLDDYQRGVPLVADVRATGDSAPAPDADATIDPPCSQSTVPPRPKATPPGTDIEFISAVSRIDVPAKAADGSLGGLNLDGRCTCPGASACRSLAAGVPKLCDQPNGIDNEFGAFYASYKYLFESDLTRFSPQASISRGTDTMFFRITGWNGLPDDDSITLHVLTAYTVKSSTKAPAAEPAFDGKDVWNIEQSTIKPGTNPYEAITPDFDAYVSGGMLVSRTNYDVRFGPIVLPVRGGRITAKIEGTPGKYRLVDGLVAGRATVSTLLTNFQVGREPLTGSNLCRGNKTYTTFKESLCGRVDIMADAVDDGKPNVECNAISLAYGFETQPAAFGDKVVRPAVQAPCGADYADSCSTK
jgi:hypothetical protein